MRPRPRPRGWQLQPRDVRGRYTRRPQPPAGCMVVFVVVFTVLVVVLANR